MGVKGKAGRKPGFSIITKNNLGDIIKEYYGEGLSYREIIEHIERRFDIQLTKMQVSRFITKNLNHRTYPNKVGLELDDIKREYTRKSNTLINDLQKIRLELINSIESEENLSGRRKTALNQIINRKMKAIESDITDSRVEMIHVFDMLRKNHEGVNNLLVEFSLSLCVDCRSKINLLLASHNAK